MVGRLDVLCYRSVCKQWRLSLPSPTLFPLRVPPPPCSELRNVAYFITECNIYYTKCGIVHMGVEELGQGSRFRRPIPICPSTAKFDCPRVSFMGDRKHPLSQFSFVGKFYCVREGLPCSNTLERPLQCTLSVRKVVIISSNSNAEGVVSSTTEGVNPGYVRVSHLSAVAILSKEAGAMSGRLALLRLGGRGENGNWNWETDFCSQAFEDIASYKGKLCAVDSTARVFLMDYHSLQMTQIAGAAKIAPGKRSKRLLEYGENL